MHESSARPWYRKLHWQILLAMAIGLAVGGNSVTGPGAAANLGWLGDLFVRLLRMVIVPLVLTSVISGVASVGGGGSLGRLFGKTMGYYVLSSLLAILTGLLVVNLIRPGDGANLAKATAQALPELSTPSSPVDLLLGMVPTNVAAAAAQGDMLALILFSILFGLAIVHLPEKPGQALLGFFDAAFQAMMQITSWVIRLAPIGVLGLMIRAADRLDGSSIKALALYMVTIASALSIHLFVTLPLLLILLGRIKPSIHFKNMIEPLTMAFSSSSSAATLPVTMNAVEKRVGVSNKVSSFVLPMGATINMDGT
ncbi:MAG: dicarboxylate/amino acid:cation symporter, partial [Acidobacteria bacterium]|nr:dicarboxylate/amino acid:cation symporter [Acidobacteriota bacterium]